MHFVRRSAGSSWLAFSLGLIVAVLAVSAPPAPGHEHADAEESLCAACQSVARGPGALPGRVALPQPTGISVAGVPSATARQPGGARSVAAPRGPPLEPAAV